MANWAGWFLPSAEARPVKPSQAHGYHHDRWNHTQTGSEILVLHGTSAHQVATTNTRRTAPRRLDVALRPEEPSLRSIRIMCKGRQRLGETTPTGQLTSTPGVPDGTKTLPRPASKSPSHNGPRDSLEELGPSRAEREPMGSYGHLGCASYTSSSARKAITLHYGLSIASCFCVECV